MKKRIYLDHAATTPMEPKVKKTMDIFAVKNFGNPSSIYKEGREAKASIEESRVAIAKILEVRREEITFTSGGTESDNLAILGVAKNFEEKFSKKGHIITSKIEHHAVLNACKYLEKKGWQVTYLKVGEDGVVKAEDVKKELNENTVLVSVMYANNEIGTIQPLLEIGKIIKNYRKEKQSSYPYFHTDACQVAGYLDLKIEKVGVDMMTLNGSKIYGPKGVGILYANRNVALSPLNYGGEQESSIKPGTENVGAIAGMAEALKIAQGKKVKEVERLTKLRDYLVNQLVTKIPKVYLNGSISQRLPNNINVSVLGVEGESLVLYLDEYGIASSTGSACSSMSLEPSHVITALGRDSLYAHGSLRLTLGRSNDKKQIDYVIKSLVEIVKKLRSVSAIKI